MNQFDVSTAFYRPLAPLIMAEKANEWAVVPSGWEEVFPTIMLGDDRAIAAVWIGGRRL